MSDLERPFCLKSYGPNLWSTWTGTGESEVAACQPLVISEFVFRFKILESCLTSKIHILSYVHPNLANFASVDSKKWVDSIGELNNIFASILYTELLQALFMCFGY
jgi:hypothetical protein